MVHENRNGVKLYDFVARLTEVFGENARVAFSYLLSTLFRDIIFRRTRHFPILNLFGEKGTGKTTLATSLQSFFLHGIDPPNMGVTSVHAMNNSVSQAINTLVVLDEYKNDLDPKDSLPQRLWVAVARPREYHTDAWLLKPFHYGGTMWTGQTNADLTLHPCHLFGFHKNLLQSAGKTSL